jgi:hypothetical protein
MQFSYLEVSILFDFVSGIVALLVSYYAFKYSRLLENNILWFLSLGFLLLALGLIVEASIVSLVDLGAGNLFSDVVVVVSASALYSFLQVAAYFLIALGYISNAYSSPSSNNKIGAGATAAILALPLFVPPEIQRLNELISLSREVIIVSGVLSVAFVSIVVFQGTVNYLQSKNNLSLLVLSSFLLILVAEGLGLLSAVSLSVTFSLIANGIRFAGFLSLLVFILWRTKIGPTRKASQ